MDLQQRGSIFDLVMLATLVDLCEWGIDGVLLAEGVVSSWLRWSRRRLLCFTFSIKKFKITIMMSILSRFHGSIFGGLGLNKVRWKRLTTVKIKGMFWKSHQNKKKRLEITLDRKRNKLWNSARMKRNIWKSYWIENEIIYGNHIRTKKASRNYLRWKRK